MSTKEEQFRKDFNDWELDMMIGPWGSHRNHAADLLGVWVWNGERDSAGAPCRYRLTYRCTRCKHSDGSPYAWGLDWSCGVDDTCARCAKSFTPAEIEDLLFDRAVCPINMEDDDD